MARWSKLGIIAGGGALPARVAAACRMRGDAFHVVRIEGSGDEVRAGLQGDSYGIGEAGKILGSLRNQDCDAVVFAGVVKRPDFSKIKVDWRGAALLPKVIAAATRGDGSLLSVLVDAVEAEGMLVIGAEEVVGDLAAPAGPLGSCTPTAQNMDDIKKAAAVIRALGSFDVGQGAVVAKGHVLAVEAAEGTDAMLSRCASLPAALRINGGVLVKRPKPGQELRIDLPAIGPDTIRRAHEASLAGIAIEANVALVIDKQEVVKAANEYGVFVYGFTAHEVQDG